MQRQKQQFDLIMKSIITAVFAILCMTATSYAQQGVNETSFGKGILNYVAKDSTFSVKFAPRIQGRYMSTWDAKNNGYGSANHEFIMRRARLKFDGWAYSPKLKYKIELGLSNKDLGGINAYTNNAPNQILDAVVMWSFAKNWELWAGQTKLPGNVERVVSSSKLQFIDRSMLNSKFNIDRDLGIQLRHKSSLGGNVVLKEKFALSQGEGRNVTTGNEGGLQYTARFELLPFGEFTKKGDYSESDLVRESSVKVMLGYTYNINYDAVKDRSSQGSYMTTSDGLYKTDITTQFVDGVLKYNGWSVLAEYANLTAANPVIANNAGVETGKVVLEGKALNAQVGYLFKNNVEIAARYSKINYAAVTGKSDPLDYTLGVSKYIVGHNLKVQADLTKATVGGENDAVIFRSGFELHF